MQPSTRRRPRTRLILTLAALASLVGGYYAGQYWQRRPLADLSAVVYAVGRPIAYPAALAIGVENGTAALWRLFLVADTRAVACRDLLWHYASVLNRLAAWPDAQDRLRVTLLAYDRPDAAAIDAFRDGVGWLEVVTGSPAELDSVSEQLGILPHGEPWCSPQQANAILVAPDRTAWALIPYEQPAIMAHNIRTIVSFVE